MEKSCSNDLSRYYNYFDNNMPYEYRRMSIEEREEVLCIRRERDYPLHAPPHPFRGAGCYFITAANYEHAHILDTPERRTEFEGLLIEAMHEIGAGLIGWVILTNHYHFLAEVESFDHISAALKRLHGFTSYAWNKADHLSGKRRVWYKFSDQLIRSENHYYCTLNYIHINPYKHGYVNDPFDWPWMSLQSYSELQGLDWLREKWKTYPPGDFGRGWDDEGVVTT
jgi:putative transposase